MVTAKPPDGSGHVSSPTPSDLANNTNRPGHPTANTDVLDGPRSGNGASKTNHGGRAGYDVAYGNYIVIWHGQNHGRSVATLYAPSAALYVHSGEKVQAGDVIGLIGATGYATGPHLHFEVRLAGRPVDPELYLH